MSWGAGPRSYTSPMRCSWSTTRCWMRAPSTSQEGRALAGGDEAFDDRLAIGLSGRRAAPGDELLSDGEVVRQKRAHFVDGAVAGGPTSDFGQARGGFGKPCVGVFDVPQSVSAMFGRIAGECEQRGFLVVVQRAAENVLDERAHRA